MSMTKKYLLNTTCLSPRTALSSRPVWRFTSVIIATVASACLFFTASPVQSAKSDSPQPVLPSIELLIDDSRLTVELASSRQQRYMGLSFRQSMADDRGMLFVYPGERPLTFTMRNTLIPLSIAFISKDLVINEIHDMDVGPGQLFESKQPAQYALEVNQGWFARRDIQPGAKLVMP